MQFVYNQDWQITVEDLFDRRLQQWQAGEFYQDVAKKELMTRLEKWAGDRDYHLELHFGIIDRDTFQLGAIAGLTNISDCKEGELLWDNTIPECASTFVHRLPDSTEVMFKRKRAMVGDRLVSHFWTLA